MATCSLQSLKPTLFSIFYSTVTWLYNSTAGPLQRLYSKFRKEKFQENFPTSKLFFFVYYLQAGICYIMPTWRRVIELFKKALGNMQSWLPPQNVEIGAESHRIFLKEAKNICCSSFIVLPSKVV